MQPRDGDTAAKASKGAPVEPARQTIYACACEGVPMCRNIRTLHNFKPPATANEIRASSLQFVRKLSGFTKPSRANEAAFNRAVDDVTRAARELLDSLVTSAPPRDREVEASKARARSAGRFGRPVTAAEP